MRARNRDLLYYGLTGLILIFTVARIIGAVQVINRNGSPITHGEIIGHLVISLLGGGLIVAVIILSWWWVRFHRKMNAIYRMIGTAVTEQPPSLLQSDSRQAVADCPNQGRAVLIRLQGILQKQRESEAKYNQLLRSYMALEEKYAQSYTVQLILEEITRELDSDMLLKKTTDIIMGVFGSKRCAIYMFDENSDALVCRADSNGNDTQEQVSIPLSSPNIIARSWRNRRVYTEADLNPRELEKLKLRNVYGCQTIPLNGHRGCLGIMLIEHERAGGLSPDLAEFARLIAQEISLAMENAYLYGKMRQMATHDALTGAFNRMYLINYMVDLFAKQTAMVTLLMFDMDHFKMINDRYGHLTGDLVLRTVSSLIQKQLPRGGILARYGGEEFVAVLPDTGPDDGYKLAESFRKQVAVHNFTNAEGAQVPVTLSMGVASYPLYADSYETLLQRADEALYLAKNAGRNKVCLYGRKEGAAVPDPITSPAELIARPREPIAPEPKAKN